MPTEELNQVTREEWRELGFFYDFDEKDSRWRLVGSRSGLLKFRDILTAYANDPRNEKISEHEHYGPYWYLKLMTCEEAGITEQAICGTTSDFRRLAMIVRGKLDSCGVGSKFIIGNEYAEGSEAVLEFEVREEGFDPASVDPLLQSNDS
jgi:hypothetical protein